MLGKIKGIIISLSVAILSIYGIIQLHRWSEQFIYIMIGVSLYAYLTVLTLLVVLALTGVWLVTIKVEHYIEVRNSNTELIKEINETIAIALQYNQDRMIKYGIDK